MVSLKSAPCRKHHEPRLLEIVIEGKGVEQAQLPHDGEAGAIGEGETFVIVSNEHLSGRLPDLLINVDQLHQWALQHPLAEINSFLVPYPETQQG